MDEVESADLSIPEYPLQNTLSTLLRVAAQQQDNKDFTTLWAGQAASKAEAKPSAAIFRQLLQQTQSLSSSCLFAASLHTVKRNVASVRRNG